MKVDGEVDRHGIVLRQRMHFCSLAQKRVSIEAGITRNRRGNDEGRRDDCAPK